MVRIRWIHLWRYSVADIDRKKFFVLFEFAVTTWPCFDSCDRALENK